MGAALEISGVSHAFGRVKALEGVSLEVADGRFVALLGVNGAGKTTLFSLITRLYDNVTGTIRVCGHDLRRQPGPALANMGAVFQSQALDRDLSVRQNLAYHAALHGITRSVARTRAEDLIREMGLADRIDSRVAALSGGQARRAEIARALLHRPRLLLLDEPTAGLDVKSRREVVALVRGLVAREGVSVLWATHLFDEIDPGDHVVVLHQGRVLASAPAGTLARGGGLADAFLQLTDARAEASP